MNELATLANIAEVLGVVIVVGGLIFARMQLQQFRQQRRELAAIELFRFFGSPGFTAGYKMIHRLPEGMTAAEIRDADGGVEDAAFLVAATMENIGVMTYQRIVPFVVVYNLMGTSAPIMWRKLENWARAFREEQGSEAAFEWFQWLAERLEEHHKFDLDPAYVGHKDWQPASMHREIGSR